MIRRPEEPRPLLNGGAEAPDDQATARLLMRLPALREDRVARERIWRALGQADRRPRSSWRPWVGVGAAVAGAGLAIVALSLVFGPRPSRSAPAILELAAGHVLLAVPQADWTGGQAGATLPAESRLRTDGVSRAAISLVRSAVIAEAATDVGLESLGRDTLLRLSGGTLVAEVDPRRGNESFVVLTTRYRVTVKGTIFLVRERAPDDVEVSVSRGRVEVAGAEGVWSVVAGQSWSSRHPSAHGVDTITDEQRRLLDEAVHPGPRSPIEVTGDGQDLVVSAAGLLLGPTPVSWNAPRGSTEPTASPPASLTASPMAAAALLPTGAMARSDEATAPPKRAVRAGSRRPRKLLARLDPPTAAAPPSLAPSPLEQALDLVRSHHYPEGERALEALSSGGGSGADIALYELASVRQRHLDDPEGALAALQLYRITYPDGALLQEAEISMIELELARPDPSAALSHIDRFLSAYPNSERASEVYYFRAVCQGRLGQTEAAAETLRTYLQRFPMAGHAADARQALGGR